MRQFSFNISGGGGSGSTTNSFETINTPAGTDPVATTPTDTLNLTSSNSTVTITGTAGTKTVDFVAVNQSVAFTTIQTPAGTSPVATGATDTLTLASTAGEIVITGNSTTDTITFTIPTLMRWAEVTGTSQSMAVNTGYIVNNAALCTLTLPTTAALGSIFRLVGKGAGGWRLAQNASQQIRWQSGGVDGTDETTSGTSGRIDSTDALDAIEIVCVTADTTFVVLSSKGNPTLT